MSLGEDRFIFSPQTGTFDLNVTWEKPLFNYSRVTSYVLTFRVHEGHEISAETVNRSLSVFSSLISLLLVTDLSINPLINSSLCGGRVVERLKRWDRKLVTLCSITSLTASYFSFLESINPLAKTTNSHLLFFRPVIILKLVLFISIICFCSYLWATMITSIGYR